MLCCRRRPRLRTDFPLDLLNALVALYAGNKAITFGQACSEPFNVGGTILAGCSCATVLAKVLFMRILIAVSGAFPSVWTENVVDDVSLQVLGPQRLVATVLRKAGNMLSLRLEGLRLPISVSKIGFVASSDELARLLENSQGRRGYMRKRQAMNLGVDAATGRKRVHMRFPGGG